MPTLRDVLLGLQGPWLEAAWGVFLSFIVEWFPKWQEVEPKKKRLLMFLFCLILPLAAKALELFFYGGAWGDFPNTWFPMLVSGFMAFGGSQLAHTRKLTNGSS